LTQNMHAIHIDPEYTKREYGLPDVIVHGPLSIVLMLDILDRALEQFAERSGYRYEFTVRKLDYRNVAPIFVGDRIYICCKPLEDPLEKWVVWITKMIDGHQSSCVTGRVIVSVLDKRTGKISSPLVEIDSLPHPAPDVNSTSATPESVKEPKDTAGQNGHLPLTKWVTTRETAALAHHRNRGHSHLRECIAKDSLLEARKELNGGIERQHSSPHRRAYRRRPAIETIPTNGVKSRTSSASRFRIRLAPKNRIRAHAVASRPLIRKVVHQRPVVRMIYSELDKSSEAPPLFIPKYRGLLARMVPSTRGKSRISSTSEPPRVSIRKVRGQVARMVPSTRGKSRISSTSETPRVSIRKDRGQLARMVPSKCGKSRISSTSRARLWGALKKRIRTYVVAPRPFIHKEPAARMVPSNRDGPIWRAKQRARSMRSSDSHRRPLTPRQARAQRSQAVPMVNRGLANLLSRHGLLEPDATSASSSDLFGPTSFEPAEPTSPGDTVLPDPQRRMFFDRRSSKAARPEMVSSAGSTNADPGIVPGDIQENLALELQSLTRGKESDGLDAPSATNSGEHQTPSSAEVNNSRLAPRSRLFDSDQETGQKHHRSLSAKSSSGLGLESNLVHRNPISKRQESLPLSAKETDVEVAAGSSLSGVDFKPTSSRGKR
jgi:acyl dehydratase